LALSRTRVLVGRKAVLVPVGLLFVLTLAREGLLGPGVAFDVSYQTTTTNQNWQTSSSFGTSGSGAPGRPLAALRVACTITGVPDGPLFDAFVGAFHCTPAADAEATVAIQLGASDPFCYVPLYKSASVPYMVTASITWQAGPGTTGTGTLTVTGSVDQTTKGIESCRAFKSTIGAAIGATTVKALNDFLASH